MPNGPPRSRAVVRRCGRAVLYADSPPQSCRRGGALCMARSGATRFRECWQGTGRGQASRRKLDIFPRKTTVVRRRRPPATIYDNGFAPDAPQFSDMTQSLI